MIIAGVWPVVISHAGVMELVCLPAWAGMYDNYIYGLMD